MSAILQRLSIQMTSPHQDYICFSKQLTFDNFLDDFNLFKFIATLINMQWGKCEELTLALLTLRLIFILVIFTLIYIYIYIAEYPTQWISQDESNKSSQWEKTEYFLKQPIRKLEYCANESDPANISQNASEPIKWLESASD